MNKLYKPERLPGESREIYVARRAMANRSIKQKLRGKVAHVSAQVNIISDIEDANDPALEQHIAAGRVLVAERVADKRTGKLVRIVKTKGTTYRKDTNGV